MTKNKEFIQARIDSIVASSTSMVHDDDDVEKDRYQRTLMSGRKVPRYREHPSNTHIFHEVKKECINHRHPEPIFCEICLRKYRRNEDSTVDFNSCHCIISGSDGSNISKNKTINPIANDESNESTYDGSGAASTRKMLEVIPKAGSINANSEEDKPNAQSKLYGEANDQHKAFEIKKLTAAGPVIDIQVEAKTKKKNNLALGVGRDNDIYEHKSKTFRRNASAIVAFLLVVVIVCICLLFTIARPRKNPLG